MRLFSLGRAASSSNISVGFAVASVGDLFDDGQAGLLVGMPNQEHGSSSSTRGSAAVVFRTPAGLLASGPLWSLAPNNSAALDARLAGDTEFGSAVAAGLPSPQAGMLAVAVGAPGLVVAGETVAKGAIFLIALNATDGAIAAFLEFSASTAAVLLPAAAQVDGARLGGSLATVGVEPSGKAWMAAGVIALRMYELQVWEEDLALEHGCLTGLVYAVAILLLGAGAFICLVFGVVFTPEQARAWLLTSLASFVLHLLVQKPVVIFCSAVALTVWGACTGRTLSWAKVSSSSVGASGEWVGVL
ncbi:hypothetical protein FNF29_02280 [Cafeteria roenbergensis]|uniref:Uncharacterized protein n=1 Tax=Cafeteria roenbergensis TaxID=33653 RepID=A0A5A8CSD7_CAFRO|nr:hypothetical protein FNF29_02280 [Cafeteria roenbergensis]|eukprot:KAA0154751.1 hypothetical protein FNF29_02280 [Cafeteria roenbergensis]